MDEIMSSIMFMCFGVFFLIFGIWGSVDFKGFMRWYIKFLDSRNTLNINYSKGTYLKTTLVGFVIMSLITGLMFVGGEVISWMKL